MEFPPEIVDHIVSFLKFPRFLLACSNAHPILAGIVRRHLYYHIVVIDDQIDYSTSYRYQSDNRRGYKLKLLHVIKLLSISDAPKIADYVRTVEFPFRSSPGGLDSNIAQILPKFHGLQLFQLLFHSTSTSSADLGHFLKCAEQLKLRSFRCSDSDDGTLQKFIGIWPDTLEHLDLSVSEGYIVLDKRIFDCNGRPKVDLSSLHCLQHLTFRVDFDALHEEDTPHAFLHWIENLSRLTEVVQICKTASTRLRHLTIDIELHASQYFPARRSHINFSRLVDLVQFVASFDHRCDVDLYIHCNTKKDFCRDDIVAELAEYEVLKESIENGALDIRVNESAPGVELEI